jgi:hypothetical protein
MKKAYILLLLSSTLSFGQSITISPNNPEHIKVEKIGTARVDLIGKSSDGVNSGNSEINLFSKGTSTPFPGLPINGEASLNFLNTGNSIPVFSIKNTHQDFFFSDNRLKITSGANDLAYFYTEGDIEFPLSEVLFGNNQSVFFGPFSGLTNKSNFNVNSRVGNTHAIFGTDYAGVSIESDSPGISLNGYYDGGRKTISNGYVGGISLDHGSGTLKLYNSSSSEIAGSSILATDRLLINSQGNVGIGISNPLASLDVFRGTGTNGTAAFKGTQWYSHFNYSTTEDTYIRGGKDAANVYINDIGTLGKVAIGNGTPTEKLHVFGNLRVSGTICNTSGAITACSDVRYKKNFSKIENPLGKVLSLNGLHYDWRIDEFKENNFSKGRQIGFIAQKLEEIFPEMVFTDEKGYKSVDYAKLTPVLVEAMKEQQKMIEDLRKANGDLKNINDKLESRLDKIESILNK